MSKAAKLALALYLVLSALTGGLAGAELLPEPDVVVFGQVFMNGAPVGGAISLHQDGQPIDEYVVGSRPEYGTQFVVRARLFSPTGPGDVRPEGAAFVGDVLTLHLNGINRGQLDAARGAVMQLDISADNSPLPTHTTSLTPPVTVQTATRTPSITPTRAITPTGTPPTATAGPSITASTGVPSATPTPTPTVTPLTPSTELSEPIDATQAFIPVADLSIFPERGTVQIGDELIRYDGITGAEGALAGTGSLPGTLNNAERGADGTVAEAHPVGAQVMLISRPCTCDCNADRRVTISELITAVNIVLGRAPLSVCPILDANGNGSAAVNEIIIGVRNTLNGCP